MISAVDQEMLSLCCVHWAHVSLLGERWRGGSEVGRGEQWRGEEWSE